MQAGVLHHIGDFLFERFFSIDDFLFYKFEGLVYFKL
jgi:hypothetical protein